MSMTTLISKLLPFFVTSDKEVSTSSRHLIITGRASTIVLITIIVRVTIVVLIIKNLCKKRGRLDEATKASLPSSNTADTGVHLTQLITESVKVSIHMLKLHHDRIKSHTTRKRRGSGGGWSSRSRRSRRLGLRPPRAKLSITPSNGSNVNGTHDVERIRWRIGDKKMVKNSRDSWERDEFIMGRYIPIDIYEGKDKVRREVNRKILNEG